MLILIFVLLLLLILYLNNDRCENFENNNNIHDKYYKCSGRYSMLIGNCQ
jgi:hypothetical protein